MAVKEKVMKIMSLALDISRLDVDYEGENRPIVEVFYFPHVMSLEVYIFENGWNQKRTTKPTFQFGIYLKKWNEKKEKQLDEVIERLSEMRGRK